MAWLSAQLPGPANPEPEPRNPEPEPQNPEPRTWNRNSLGTSWCQRLQQLSGLGRFGLEHERAGEGRASVLSIVVLNISLCQRNLTSRRLLAPDRDLTGIDGGRDLPCSQIDTAQNEVSLGFVR